VQQTHSTCRPTCYTQSDYLHIAYREHRFVLVYDGSVLLFGEPSTRYIWQISTWISWQGQTATEQRVLNTQHNIWSKYHQHIYSLLITNGRTALLVWIWRTTAVNVQQCCCSTQGFPKQPLYLLLAVFVAATVAVSIALSVTYGTGNIDWLIDELYLFSVKAKLRACCFILPSIPTSFIPPLYSRQSIVFELIQSVLFCFVTLHCLVNKLHLLYSTRWLSFLLDLRPTVTDSLSETRFIISARDSL
jgi:hypothetical protein